MSFVQNLSHLGGELIASVRLAEKIDACIESSVMDDGVFCIVKRIAIQVERYGDMDCSVKIVKMPIPVQPRPSSVSVMISCGYSKQTFMVAPHSTKRYCVIVTVCPLPTVTFDPAAPPPV